MAMCALMARSFLYSCSAAEVIVDRDDFQIKNDRQPGVQLNGTKSEVSRVMWNAGDSLVFGKNGADGVIHVLSGKAGPVSASFPVDWPAPIERGAGIIRLMAKIDLGGFSGKGAWFGFGLARNVSTISVNGNLWVRISAEGKWSLLQFNDRPLAQGEIREKSSVHEVVLEVDPSNELASLLIDGEEVVKQIPLEKPPLSSLRRSHVLVHFQWLDSKVLLDSVELKVITR